MKNIIVVLVLLLSMVSCDKVKKDTHPFEGTYIGYGHSSGQDTQRVTIYFKENAYRSEGATAYEPASGTFNQDIKTIQFNIASSRTSASHNNELNGQYNYQLNPDGTVRIWRQQDSQLDEYILMHAVAHNIASVTP